MFVSDSGTLHWVAALVDLESQGDLLRCMSRFMTINGVPNQLRILNYSAAQFPLPVMLDPIVDLISGEEVTVDVLAGPWTYTLERHSLVNFASTPVFYGGLSPVMSLHHTRPLSMWLIFEIFDLDTWIAGLGHVLGVALLLLLLGKSRDVFIGLMGIIFGQDFSLFTSHQVKTPIIRLVRTSLLVYFVMACWTLDEMFNQELLNILFNRDGDNIESLDEAVGLPDVVILFPAPSLMYNVLYKDFIAANEKRVVPYGYAIVPARGFFDPDHRRVVAAAGQGFIGLTEEFLGEFNFHIGADWGMTSSLGWMFSRRAFAEQVGPEHVRMLNVFQCAIIATHELGMSDYWNKQSNRYQAPIAAMFKRDYYRLAAAEGGLETGLDGGLEVLTVDHLRLPFIILAILLTLCCTVALKEKCSVKKKKKKKTARQKPDNRIGPQSHPIRPDLKSVRVKD